MSMKMRARNPGAKACLESYYSITYGPSKAVGYFNAGTIKIFGQNSSSKRAIETQAFPSFAPLAYCYCLSHSFHVLLEAATATGGFGLYISSLTALLSRAVAGKLHYTVDFGMYGVSCQGHCFGGA